MPEKLTNHERETIINFNEAEDKASIFTHNKAWQRHLEHKLRLKCIMNNGCGGKEYEIDKKRIPMPRMPRRLSAETKERLAKNLRQRCVLSSRKPSALAKSADETSSKGKSLRTGQRSRETPVLQRL